MHVETKVDTNSAISDDAPNFDDKSEPQVIESEDVSLV